MLEDNATRMALVEMLTIKNKRRAIVPFKLNYIQRRMALERTGSDIYVKPRQVGASEFLLADATIETALMPGTTTIIVAYEEEATKRLLAKADWFFESLQSECLQDFPWMGTRDHKAEYKKTFKFYKERGSDKSGQWGPPSVLYIASARSFVIARGDSYHNVIADEFAYWPQPEKLFELLGGRTPDSRFAILSTPNGEMNQFREMYETALEHILLGDNVYTAHFFPWFVHEEYTLSANSEQALKIDQVSPLLDLDSDETSMMASQRLTEDQIRWRRFKSSEMEQMRQHGETRILFSQEFPEDDTTCFLTFGDMAYDAPILDDMFKASKKPERSFLKADIWYEPENDVKYLVAIDPGEGRTSMTAITVWTFDRDKEGFDYAKHCATIHGLYPPERTAELVRGIAAYYNWAVVAPEVNISTLAILLKNYPNKYMLKDPLTGRRLGTFGWPTTPSSKPLMTNELRMMLPRVTCHDSRIIKEIRNMRVDQSNENRVISTGLDDLHDSVCIAMICREARATRKGFAFSAARKG
ncbi:hypothetical protein LCGC14_0894850 [marine sediment metagenome]|uniref:Terminase large subunit gp17-like C-terminal domain-containing protein n=1 Tax=marine sediment metagenome TaxID=412755 RepID=A0A0F9NY52_9ZZZZ